METLDKISKRFTPKKQYLRTFIKRYEQLFELIRNNDLTILEIGIGGYKDPKKGGGSLRMWAEYFPKSTIVGLDLHNKHIELPENVKVHIGSQTDTEFLNSLTEQYGGFDIVIDDASHVTAYTIKTFEALWERTRLMYIVEDLHMKTAIGTKEYFQNIPFADFETTNLCIIKK